MCFGLENLQGKDVQLVRHSQNAALFEQGGFDAPVAWQFISHLDASADDVAATAPGALEIPICTARMKTPSLKDTCEVISGWRNLPCRSVGKLSFSLQSWSCNHLVGCDHIFTGVQLGSMHQCVRTMESYSARSSLTKPHFCGHYLLLSWKRGDQAWWA